jgi:hypothetical protein
MKNEQQWAEFNRSMVVDMSKDDLMRVLSQVVGYLEYSSEHGNKYAGEVLQFIYDQNKKS